VTSPSERDVSPPRLVLFPAFASVLLCRGAMSTSRPGDMSREGGPSS